MQLSSTARSRARVRTAFAMTALTLAAACGGQNPSSDAALRNDLSLAGKPGATQQVVSPQEMTPAATAPVAPVPGAVAATGAPATALAPTTAAPAPAPAPAPVRERIVYRDRPEHHSTRHSSSGTYSDGETVVHEAPRPTVRTSHTKEGAAIGGAAGALIGAATGGGVKGAIIGGILGGGAGAVVGNNTGVKHEPQP